MSNQSLLKIRFSKNWKNNCLSNRVHLTPKLYTQNYTPRWGVTSIEEMAHREKRHLISLGNFLGRLVPPIKSLISFKIHHNHMVEYWSILSTSWPLVMIPTLRLMSRMRSWERPRNCQNGQGVSSRHDFLIGLMGLFLLLCQYGMVNRVITDNWLSYRTHFFANLEGTHFKLSK